MIEVKYELMINENDIDLLKIKEIYKLPEIAKYISISDNYFHYVTNTPNVHYYKIYDNDKLIGTTHLEIENNILYMDLLIFPEFQNLGYGTKVIDDIKNKKFKLDYNQIFVAIDETNISSLNLFKKLGFVVESREDELFNLIYVIK